MTSAGLVPARSATSAIRVSANPRSAMTSRAARSISSRRVSPWPSPPPHHCRRLPRTPLPVRPGAGPGVPLRPGRPSGPRTCRSRYQQGRHRAQVGRPVRHQGGHGAPEHRPTRPGAPCHTVAGPTRRQTGAAHGIGGPRSGGDGRGRAGPGGDASWSPTRARARPWCGSRPAGCATPTSTTGRAASTTTSRSCSATRRPASSRRSGPDVTDRGPRRLRGPQLAGRLRRVPVVPAGPAVVLLRHPQRHPEDDPGRRHAAVARRSASAPSPRRPWWPPASAPRSTRRPGPRRSGLLGCGVMAGLGRGHAHRRGRPGRLGGRVRLRRRGLRRGRRGACWPGPPTIIAVDLDPRKLELAREFGATHTVDASAERPGRGRPGAHRRQRRRRVHRGGRATRAVMEQAFYARDLAGTVVQVGVPTPDMRIDLPMIEFFGRGGALKPSLVRRLPAQPGLPDAGRPLPAGPARPRPVRHRDHRPRRRRGGVRPHGARRGAALGRGARDDRAGRHRRGSSRLDGEDFEVDNNIWLVGDDTEVVVIDAAHDHRPIVERRRRPSGGGRRVHPRRTTRPAPGPTGQM